MKGTDFKDFKAELLKNKEIHRSYEELKPKYEIIEAIITRRNEMSLSQRKLARLVGMQQPAISRLERGDKNVTIGTLFRVTEALNLKIDCTPKVG